MIYDHGICGTLCKDLRFQCLMEYVCSKVQLDVLRENESCLVCERIVNGIAISCWQTAYNSQRN